MNAIEEFVKYKVADGDVKVWFKAAKVEDFPSDAGACVKYKTLQVAVFNFKQTGEWYACQNMCPHKMTMILSRGMLGGAEETPKVACPFHKRTFSLESGECLNAEEQAIVTYPVKIEDGYVYVGFNE